MKNVKIATFLKERKIKLKPDEANNSNLKRIEKIDFAGNITMAPTKTKTDMILVKKGDLVISGINVEKGALTIYQGEEDVLASIHYSAYEFDETQIYILYLKYFLKSREFRKLLIEQSGSGIKNEIKAKHILPLEIKLPSMQEQHRIVERIQAVENDIVELDKEVIQQYEYCKNLRQSILQQAVEGKLCEQTPDDEPASVLLEKIKKEKGKLIKEGKIKKQKDLLPVPDEKKTFEIPNGWERCRLGEITEILRGSSPRPKGSPLYWSGVKNENHWITISDITAFCKNNYLKDTSEYLTQKGTQYSTYVSENDLIIAVSGSTTGKSCLTGINGYIYDGLACIRTIGNCVEHSYLYYYMQHMYQKLNDSKIGSAFPNINTEVLKNMIFSLPPLQEQRRIVEKVDEFMSLCDKLENEVNKAQQYAAQLMESVLQEAFTTDEQATEDQPKHKGKVVPIRPKQKAELRFAMAARGNIKQSTLESLQKRAIEISNGEK